MGRRGGKGLFSPGQVADRFIGRAGPVWFISCLIPTLSVLLEGSSRSGRKDPFSQHFPHPQLFSAVWPAARLVKLSAWFPLILNQVKNI